MNRAIRTVAAGLTFGLAITGSALAARLPLDLAPFSKANIATAINASVVVGPTQSVVVETDDPAALEDVRVEVVNGELRAWIETGIWRRLTFRHDDIHLIVTVPALNAIAATSAADVTVAGATGDIVATVSSAARIVLSEAAISSAELSAASAGSLVLSGTCKSASVRTDSGAHVNAGAFKCEDLTVDASSGATAQVAGAHKVEASASSGAHIVLVGRPAELRGTTNAMFGIDILD